MVNRNPPAISGVSAEAEALIMTVYPSIAATALGRLIGSCLESLPLKIGGVKLSHLLFFAPAAAIAAPLYGFLKLFGETYVLTNRGVQKRSSLGNRLISQVPLTSIEDVVVREEPGQAFYPAADIYLMDKSGTGLAVLAGVPRADVFRQTIVEARDAHKQVAAALKTIKARQRA